MSDDALQAALRAAADPDYECDFCGRSPAAELDVLTEAFFNGIRTEYADAGDEYAYWEGELAAVRSWSGEDLVDEYSDVFRSDELHMAVRNAAFGDDVWVETDFIALRHDEALREGWERLCKQVMYKTRYVFWLGARQEDEHYLGAGEIPAAEILDALGGMIPKVGVLRELPAGSKLWRARTHEDREVSWGASDLGTAPPERAKQSNRMSPAGIPLFYGADSPDTAIRETSGHSDNGKPFVTFAEFETSHPCMVVDFTLLDPVPSIFDVEKQGVRRSLMFLHDFVKRLSADHDGREHLEYVPTQVVTEYLLRVFGQDQPVVGLVFRSAAKGAGDDSICTVLDVPHLRCVEQEPGWCDAGLSLGLVPGSMQTAERPASGLA
ncbi:hypothetical protein VM95_21385 [Streptomyces rubellomurinus]|uniref:RES domain-containing protein n=1 Tax=Streptomyces rubellomurinus (strain ATCC 31215) TaxID=359131 RepID=A0A0F2TB17_STRR3|nr:hypothetical protein VM95_21385 [Streptomyces rubellomurinus]